MGTSITVTILILSLDTHTNLHTPTSYTRLRCCFSAFARSGSADPPWCGLAENHLNVQALFGLQDLTAAVVTVC